MPENKILLVHETPGFVPRSGVQCTANCVMGAPYNNKLYVMEADMCPTVTKKTSDVGVGILYFGLLF